MDGTTFEQAGYLSDQTSRIMKDTQSDNPEWFQLAQQLNIALMSIARHATDTVKSGNWEPEAVATRILLRSCGTFQGAVLMAERGMTAEARILARSLMEDAFCVAGLVSTPKLFLKMLQEDSEASRRLQGKFIEAAGLVAKGETRDKLVAAIDALGKPDTMNIKKLAGLGALVNQYLYYQRLSDDSAHTSARALEHHVERAADNSGWHYKWQPAKKEENAATLQHIVLGALPVGIGLTEVLKDEANGKLLLPIIERFDALKVATII
jgi:hypothetical protein